MSLGIGGRAQAFKTQGAGSPVRAATPLSVDANIVAGAARTPSYGQGLQRDRQGRFSTVIWEFAYSLIQSDTNESLFSQVGVRDLLWRPCAACYVHLLCTGATGELHQCMLVRSDIGRQYTNTDWLVHICRLSQMSSLEGCQRSQFCA